VNLSELETANSVLSAGPSGVSGTSQALEVYACWNEIGVQGKASCPELQNFVHCRNCPVYSNAAVQLLDRPLLPQYRRERTEDFAQPKQPVAQPKQPVAQPKTSALVFRLNAEWLALPTQAFQEVAEPRPVHSLPQRRQGIVLGLVSIRGELLICVSLGHLLGLDRAPSGKTRRRAHDRLLVTNWDGNRLVFPADEVRGLHRFQMSELEEPPATLAKSNLSYTQGLLAWQGKTVGLLDAHRLFSSLNRSLS
jgi:chemotaxis-related protein WspD